MPSHLETLLSVNLRLLNPKVTNCYRRKAINGPQLTKKLVAQLLLNLFIFLLMYGLLFSQLDLSKLPGVFGFYSFEFIFMSLSQGMLGIYNIFFANNSKDLLMLPFLQREIFLSKVITVAMNVIPYTLPLLLQFFLTSWRSGINFWISIVLALVLYILISIVTLLSCTVFIFLMLKIKLFAKHAMTLIYTLITLSSAALIAGIFVIDNQKRDSFSMTLPLFQMVQNPFAVENLINWILLLAFLGLLVLLVERLVLPNINENIILSKNLKCRKQRKTINLRDSLKNYNWQLLKEPNVLFQIFGKSIIIPLIYIFSFGFSKIPTNLSSEFFGVFVVSGIVLSLVTTTSSSLFSIIISLDRGNFSMIRSLPISIKGYLKIKFIFAYLIQIIINSILIVIFSIVLKINLIMMCAMFIGSLLGSYLVGLAYFREDYKNRVENWNNIDELFNRNGGSLRKILLLLCNIFFGSAIIIVYGLLISSFPNQKFINTIAFIISSGSSFGIWRYYMVNFWNRLQL